MDKSELYQFSPNDRIVMPRPIAKLIEAELKQGSVSVLMEEIYQIVRDECIKYNHADNSNARKFLTARVLQSIRKVASGEGRKTTIIRKIPVSAVSRIADALGLSSGKFKQGKQVKMFTTVLHDQFKAN